MTVYQLESAAHPNNNGGADYLTWNGNYRGALRRYRIAVINSDKTLSFNEAVGDKTVKEFCRKIYTSLCNDEARKPSRERLEKKGIVFNKEGV